MTLLVSLALAAAGVTFGPPAQDPDQDAGYGGPGPVEAPPLCPEPLLFEPRWAPLELTGAGRVVFTEEALEPLAHVLAADFAAVTGVSLAVAGKPARSGDIVLTLGYLPVELRQNDEAFFVEVLDHVLISGQTVRGAARGAARFLQLAQPTAPPTAPPAGAPTAATSAPPPSALVAPARIVDAPSVRWRALVLTPAALLEADGSVSAAHLARLVAAAHLAGHNALVVAQPDGAAWPTAQLNEVVRTLRLTADARQVTVAATLEAGPESALAVAPPAIMDRVMATPDALRTIAARLDAEGTDLLCARAPFSGTLAPDLLGEGAPETTRRARRFLAPIAPIGSHWEGAGAAQPLGQLYGQRDALEPSAPLPAAWVAARDEAASAALAGEAWHGGMRFDALRGAGELRRVLDRVDAALARGR